MTTTSPNWETSVTEAVHIFRDGLRALLPIASRARMRWKEPENYDDWDHIAEALYESIVIRALKYSTQWDDFEDIPKFDHRISDYSNRSYIFLTEAGEQKPFICFHTRTTPFDTALLATVDEHGKVTGISEHELAKATFAFSGLRSGKRSIVDRISVVL